MKQFSVVLTGVTPILFKNGRTANPLDGFARGMKLYNGKKDKTDEDFEALAKLEFFAGLYTDKTIACDRATAEITVPMGAKLVIGAHVVDSNIRKGASRFKQGKSAAAGCMVDADAEFYYDGSRRDVPVEDWENFAYTTAVNITRNKIMRTRPRFSSWKAKFTVSTDASVCTAEQLKRWIDAAGHLVGIGDWRPEKCGHYGRYTAEVTEVSK